jgi:hypothetical protein
MEQRAMNTTHTSQLLIFSNTGEIDPRLITTMGVNVKDCDSPIGYFGTGLKYAIAVALRLGCRVTVQSGLVEHRFDTERTSIRGKEFGFITMATAKGGKISAPQTLGFTTELGKNWLPWMAYREFECNAIDEGEESSLAWDVPEPTEGHTRVVISGAPLVEEFFKKGQWRLQSKAIVDGEDAEVHLRQPGNNGLFYRGVKVADLPKQPMFAYNVKRQLTLTEDRTLSSLFAAQRAIALTVMMSAIDETLIGRLVCPPKGSWEEDIDWDWYDSVPSETWTKVVYRKWLEEPAKLRESALVVARRANAKLFEEEIEEAELTTVEHRTMQKAVEFLQSVLNVKLQHPVKVVESLGQYEILGMARDGVIWIARGTLARGTKVLAGTLLEEHLHLAHQLDDFSQSMQNWLIDKLISTGEQVRGEPL